VKAVLFDMSLNKWVARRGSVSKFNGSQKLLVSNALNFIKLKKLVKIGRNIVDMGKEWKNSEKPKFN
jgi:hypothetical protein